MSIQKSLEDTEHRQEDRVSSSCSKAEMDRKTHRGESREWTGRLIVEKVENGQEDSSWSK